MNFPAVYLSVPSARLPSRAYRNEDLLERVRGNFRGEPGEWRRVESRIRSLWRICGTDVRYIDELTPSPLAGHAAAVATECLAANGLGAADLDVMLYGSIAREYFEPATAAEVAARIGAERALPIDVTSACAGSVLAVQSFIGRAAFDPDVRLGLVTTATYTFPTGQIRYDLQNVADIDLYGAGLTLGHAATAMALSTTPLPNSGRIVGALAEGLPAHHGLCRAPVNGYFMSQGAEIFALSRHVPAHVRRMLARVGWTPGDVDLFVSHQPSNHVLANIARQLEVPTERIPALHGLYGNTADSAVPLALWHLQREGRLFPGAKLVLSTAASGFVMASLAVEWGG